MDQQVKSCAASPKYFSLIPGIYAVKEKPNFYKLSSGLHMCVTVFRHVHKYIHNKWIKIKEGIWT